MPPGCLHVASTLSLSLSPPPSLSLRLSGSSAFLAVRRAFSPASPRLASPPRAAGEQGPPLLLPDQPYPRRAHGRAIVSVRIELEAALIILMFCYEKLKKITKDDIRRE
ncbi:hypothetical protein GUJ93_ZPchr0004g38284 [Zizania palustris]|uniref:Uncharacterized protein n=1 Tax=Zizania palustris TaxID=103762 RepID=A0A8J5SDU4_ZIZPA|nr:hypothetical protein GUJ93_ZPchr0004g38284 [Zizania palustris]